MFSCSNNYASAYNASNTFFTNNETSIGNVPLILSLLELLIIFQTLELISHILLSTFIINDLIKIDFSHNHTIKHILLNRN